MDKDVVDGVQEKVITKYTPVLSNQCKYPNNHYYYLFLFFSYTIIIWQTVIYERRIFMEKAIEKAKIVQNKYCNACAGGALCMLDGPVPDFEIMTVAALFGVAD